MYRPDAPDDKMGTMPAARAAALAAALLAAGSCQKSSPSAPTGPPVATSTVTITASGANPRNIEVPLGARVLFINNDSRAHDMSSDPHPDHTDCPEINQAGFLQPGQQRETGNLVQTGTCTFHDHDNPSSQLLRGTITIK
jgi:plastocyanin